MLSLPPTNHLANGRSHSRVLSNGFDQSIRSRASRRPEAPRSRARPPRRGRPSRWPGRRTPGPAGRSAPRREVLDLGLRGVDAHVGTSSGGRVWPGHSTAGGRPGLPRGRPGRVTARADRRSAGSRSPRRPSSRARSAHDRPGIPPSALEPPAGSARRSPAARDLPAPATASAARHLAVTRQRSTTRSRRRDSRVRCRARDDRLGAHRPSPARRATAVDDRRPAGSDVEAPDDPSRGTRVHAGAVDDVTVRADDHRHRHRHEA